YNDFLALPPCRWLVRFGDWLEWVKAWLTSKRMFRLAVVGDLSMQAPDRLDRVLRHALKHSDLVVQVGDMHPAYDVLKKHLGTGRLLVIPGNHDDRFDG